MGPAPAGNAERLTPGPAIRPERQAAGGDANPGAAGADDPAQRAFSEDRARHWDEVARGSDDWEGWGGAYHRRLEEVYRRLAAPGLRVLEVGCGRGDLLAALRPGVGVGVDLSGEMIARAAARHPELRLVRADAHDLALDETFDVVILSDLLNELWDVQRALERVRSVCHARTRVIVNTYSRLWDWPLRAVKGLGLARPMLDQNWLTVADTRNLLELAGFETVKSWPEVLLPLAIPGVSALLNKVAVRVWPLGHLALSNFIVARCSSRGGSSMPPRVSVVIPARNEAGNIAGVFERTPEMGVGTELVLVEGHSTDGTYEAIERAIAARPGRAALLIKQEGKGKADAVRLGFARAGGDILVILDADLTVPPEDLPRFVDALTSGRAEFVNGVRLVYPMQKRAMRLLNLAGNKFFSAAFSWILGRPIKDTLCGSKALWAADYRAIAAGRPDLGRGVSAGTDPFGDFDLLFGAAGLNLKIVDLPVRYRERRYGATNIHRFRHGWLLLRMVWIGARRLRFR